MSTEVRRDHIQYGNIEIDFEVTQRNRKTLEINVLPDQRVTVVAPFDASHDDIRERVVKRADWILKQKQYFAQFPPSQPEREYVPGESHLFMGRQYRLKFTDEEELGLKTDGDLLLVSGTRKPVTVAKLIDDWYRAEAKKVIKELIDSNWPKMSSDPMPKFGLQAMQKRWGSCSANGNLLFNYQLVKAPKSCIEYVVIHELCHIFEQNHSPKFFELLNRYCPDWDGRKQKLEQNIC